MIKHSKTKEFHKPPLRGGLEGLIISHLVAASENNVIGRNNKIPWHLPNDLKFSNTGNIPLKLDNVQAACGCTTPEWSKEAVPAGGSSIITVGYNAASDGPFTKSITITYNGTQSKQINIKGEVWKTPAASAPENSALESLKNQ
jgi:hypothetical protein